MKKIVILGATSAIAIACARRWANNGSEILLAARNGEQLNQVADDLSARGAKVHTEVIDLSSYQIHQAFANRCFESLGHVDILLFAYGTLPDQQQCESDNQYALTEFHSNGLSVISLLNCFSLKMQAQGLGTIAVISSVAGDRGRASNYLYGSAKAAVSTFCSGLRAKLFTSGVHLLTVKPGFVDTPMTEHLTLPALLTASAEQVAGDIDRAIVKKKSVIYSRWYWRYIMLVVLLLPNVIFNRMKF